MSRVFGAADHSLPASSPLQLGSKLARLHTPAAVLRSALVRTIHRTPAHLDARLKVSAYELLFRAGPQNIFQPRKDASSSVIVDSATLFDLPTLAGHAKAFINSV